MTQSLFTRLNGLLRLAALFTVLFASSTVFAAGAITADVSEETAAVLDKESPDSIEDLKRIEQQTRMVAEKVTPAVVAVRVGQAWGSGVVINEEGVVLTAGHVNMAPGKKVKFFFPDGSTADGETLGMNPAIDSGMMKITSEGDFPFVELGESKDLKAGHWCVAIGHPGGFDEERPYVVRLGRIIANRPNVIQSDCTLVGGDSGGPLFDMSGKVIGIHSRISSSTTSNFHVPVDTYHRTWARLAAGEVFGGNNSDGGYLGIRGADHREGVEVMAVLNDTPADEAGLKPGDIITHFDGQPFVGWPQFADLIGERKAGDKIVLKVKRGNAELGVRVELAERQ